MKVLNTYIVNTDDGVHRVLYQTFTNKWFITGHIVCEVYEITSERALTLI